MHLRATESYPLCARMPIGQAPRVKQGNKSQTKSALPQSSSYTLT